MSAADRQELIRNAVIFLADPKTQASSLTQRIQFLEAKGLTPTEIDVAIKQSSLNSASPYPTHYPPGHLPPFANQWDWRDYFITAVISGSVAYGAVTLFKKYLSPYLHPPNSTAYEEDRDALTAQFDAAEALLKEIQSESAAVRVAVEEQKTIIDKAITEVETAVKEMHDGENRTRDEMREIRDEVNNVWEMLPKMIEKNRETQSQSLAELQQELKSLKALLLSRGPGSIPSSPLPVLGRPSIPAWQLASTGQSNGTEGPSITTPSIQVVANGKGKESEVQLED